MSSIKVVKKGEKRLPTRSELQSELNDMHRRWQSFRIAVQAKIDKWPINPEVEKVVK